MQLRITVIALIAVIVGRDATTASACSCDGNRTIPEHGMAGVPTNLSEIVGRYLWHRMHELRNETTGEIVPLGAPQHDDIDYIDRIAVLATLDPETPYLLSGHDNPSDPWRAVSSFTTGPGPDLTPPAAIGVSGLRGGRTAWGGNIGSSCGPEMLNVLGELSGVDDAATIGMRMRRDGDLQEALLPASPSALRWLGVETCSIAFDAKGGERWELDLWARDLAGNEGPVTTVILEVKACAPVSRTPVMPDVDGCVIAVSPDDLPIPGDESHDGGCASHRGGGWATLLMSVALLAGRRRHPRS